ncbi:MAG: GH3 auxin-responsive promoter family protein, partial [Elusimicrobia bacterium]|nr:GH3 auxin-responsive promoter family protein [Elusimicrobiota bacterium]
YAILLTTRSGLYRYDLNDIVEVSGFYRQTPVLAFVRKGRDMTSITGEKMHPNHFLAVMDEVRRKFGIDFEQFRAVSDVEGGRYRLLIEAEGELSENVLRDQVLVFIDQALAKVNIEYGQKRASKRLHLPLISLMRRGWAEGEYRRFQKSGKSDIQFKWRTLCPEMTQGGRGLHRENN